LGYDTIVELLYVLKSDVSAISDGEPGFVTVTLKETIAWEKLYFTPGGGKWNEKTERTKSGLMFTQYIQVNCLRDTLSEWADLNTLLTMPLLICLVFKNGNKLVGSLEKPVRLLISTDTSGGLGIEFSMKRDAMERAKWMTIDDL